MNAYNIKQSVQALMIVTLLILVNSISFAEENVAAGNSHWTAYQAILESEIGECESYLYLTKDINNSIEFIINIPGEYLYYGKAVKQDQTYVLEETSRLFSDCKLELSMDEGSVKFTLTSENLDLNMVNVSFKKMYGPMAVVVNNGTVASGEALFYSDTFMLRYNNGISILNRVNTGQLFFNMLSDYELSCYQLALDYISVFPWETQGDGCSWYCGVVDYWVDASSELEAIGKNSYTSENAHDYSLRTAWIEGVDGDGIGELIQIAFPSDNPRVTKINIYNGYQKNENTYYNNNRVKTLTLVINGFEYRTLNLIDTPKQQSFDIDMAGVMTNEDDLEFVFRIDEVYPGDKYSDTAISEINFDGVDVH